MATVSLQYCCSGELSIIASFSGIFSLYAVVNMSRTRAWLPFQQARMLVRKEKLEKMQDWHIYSKSRRPRNIPSSPQTVYAGQGWKGFPDWLGRSRLNVGKEIVLPEDLALQKSAQWPYKRFEKYKKMFLNDMQRVAPDIEFCHMSKQSTLALLYRPLQTMSEQQSDKSEWAALCLRTVGGDDAKKRCFFWGLQRCQGNCTICYSPRSEHLLMIPGTVKLPRSIPQAPAARQHVLHQEYSVHLSGVQNVLLGWYFSNFRQSREQWIVRTDKSYNNASKMQTLITKLYAPCKISFGNADKHESAGHNALLNNVPVIHRSARRNKKNGYQVDLWKQVNLKRRGLSSEDDFRFLVFGSYRPVFSVCTSGKSAAVYNFLLSVFRWLSRNRSEVESRKLATKTTKVSNLDMLILLI